MIYVLKILLIIVRKTVRTLRYFKSGKKMQKMNNESETKCQKSEVDRNNANRSFSRRKGRRDCISTRERSQSYTEGKSSKTCPEMKRIVLSNSGCSSYDEVHKDIDGSVETMVENSIIDDVVKEGRYFLGENLGRMTRDIDGSRSHIDTLDDDQLEWDDETELTLAK